MEQEIVNRVANSKLTTIDLKDYLPSGKRLLLDIKDWLYEGILLREKEFRSHLDAHDWSIYQDAYVALTCSTDAIVPGWAFMLVTTRLAPAAKTVVLGNLSDLENQIFCNAIVAEDFSKYQDLPIIIKGCSDIEIPQNAYITLVQHLQPFAKSILYGEACSTVPLFKKR